MKRITAWAAVLTLTLSLLTGCAQIDESSADELPFPSEETPAEEEHSGLPAVFALPYLEGQPLNPLTCPDGVQQMVASLLYEGLFRLDQTFTPQPLLCASYTYDSETLTYKLTLRDGVVFSDGSPLTAADVKTTLNAARSSARYARRLSDVKSISAGDGTVTLTLNRPNTGLPALLDIPILKSGTEKHSVPLGTGPYLYDESSESCLIASQNWWRHLSQPVERISLTGTADQESMLYRFSSRDVQLIVADLTGTDPVAVSGSVSYDDADTTVFQYLGINVSAKGLDDAAFRRCLSLGVSRRALVSSLLSGHAKAAQFPVSPVSPLYPADLEQTDSVVAFTDALNACETRPSRTLRLLVNSENSFKVSMARQIARTCLRRGYAGAAADFDPPARPGRLALLEALSPLLASCGRTLYVPEHYPVAGATILLCTALSGGTLEGRLTQAVDQYGAEHLALDLQRLTMDFPLPCPGGQGTPLTLPQLEALAAGRPTFYSDALCARYFTLTRQGQTHFVLFDDARTLRRKLELARQLGIRDALVMLPEVEDLLEPLFAGET